MVKLWDFDFACIPGVIDNSKVDAEWTTSINVRPEKHQYYDIHYFFNTMLSKGFYPDILNRSRTPPEVVDFVERVLPPSLRRGNKRRVSKSGRLLDRVTSANPEYTTPEVLLRHDTFFTKFRVDEQGIGKSNDST